MKKSTLLWCFLVATSLGLFLGIPLEKFVVMDGKNPTDTTLESLGEIVEIRGSLMSQNQNQAFFHRAELGQQITLGEQLITGADSEALISLGASFWLQSNSQIRVVRKKKQPLQIHLLAGRLKRVNSSGTAKAVEVYVSGTLRTEDLIQRGQLAEISKLPLEDVQVSSLESIGPAEKIEGVNELQIHQNFRLHQRFIEKCFIAHYSSVNGKTKSGKVWLRFKIVDKGKVQAPKVSRSDYTDEKFHNCLENVAARVKIKGYKGPMAQVEFPIDINLPDAETP